LTDRAWFERLNLNYDEPLSNFAFNHNLRRYNLVMLALFRAHAAPTHAYR